MILIELTGLPGCGKSYLLPFVKKYFYKKSIKVYDRKSLIFATSPSLLFKSFYYIFDVFPVRIQSFLAAFFYKISKIKEKSFSGFIVENWQFYDSVMQIILRSRFNTKEKMMLSAWFINLVTYFQIGKDYLNENDVLIIDEGFFHKVVNFFNNPEDKAIELTYIEGYLNKIPELILIHVHTEIDICQKRLENRELPRFIRGKSKEVVYNFLTKSLEIIEHSQKILKKKNRTIVTIDNSDTGIDRSKIFKALESLNIK